MDTEEEKARKALDMFCRAAEKETGDVWDVQSFENGDLGVVQTFKEAKETLDNPKIPDEEKKLLITGAIFCASSGGLAGLADRLVKSFERDPPPPGAVHEILWPLPFLDGCLSVEEMAIRLAAYS